jgi:hypothetical protein
VLRLKGRRAPGTRREKLRPAPGGSERGTPSPGVDLPVMLPGDNEPPWSSTVPPAQAREEIGGKASLGGEGREDREARFGPGDLGRTGNRDGECDDRGWEGSVERGRAAEIVFCFRPSRLCLLRK